MMIPSDAVMAEAFRRAQMRGHVFPQTCDFPPSVSSSVVEMTYLAPLKAVSGASGAPSRAEDTPVLQRGPLEMTAFSRETDDASFLTNGGDAWAAILLLEEDDE
ncbi:hypothetical protein ABL78_4970 [Leptomonas seymouri]|uniref:Uncharacterized protein n=1 Tax=Leptomonas seymouri TaxID=5684 RepID=A0A0N1IJS1_LEPSE|nr:hypothetical protein ABL78_4970 [Leptomonas seymouri]|eukprot:KPI85968.1 hypothetical protein ABL78_4970 [Leptomonas seymouri]